MTIPGLVLLLARTTRSQAYAQAFRRRGVRPEAVLLFGPTQPTPKRVPAPAKAEGIYLPDLREPLKELVATAGWTYESEAAADVNDPAIARWLREQSPRTVVYSGFGGQIVGAEVLEIATVLHAHSGWLPAERGSTTLYYGILERRRSAVSVLELRPEIDAGPILARAEYPLPPAGIDVDHVWDGAIRADLLTRTLLDLRAGSQLSAVETAAEAENEAGGRMHYIIHPVLKHLALMSLETRGAAS